MPLHLHFFAIKLTIRSSRCAYMYNKLFLTFWQVHFQVPRLLKQHGACPTPLAGRGRGAPLASFIHSARSVLLLLRTVERWTRPSRIRITNTKGHTTKHKYKRTITEQSTKDVSKSTSNGNRKKIPIPLIGFESIYP